MPLPLVLALMAMIGACSADDAAQTSTSTTMCNRGQRYVDGKCVFTDSLFISIEDYSASSTQGDDLMWACAVTGESLYITHLVDWDGCYFSPGPVSQASATLAAGDLHLKTGAGEITLAPVPNSNCFAQPGGDFVQPGGAVKIVTTGGAIYAPLSIDDALPAPIDATVSPAQFARGEPYAIHWTPSGGDEIRVFISGDNGIIDCSLPDTGSHTIAPALTNLLEMTKGGTTQVFRNKRVHLEPVDQTAVVDISLRSGKLFLTDPPKPDPPPPPECSVNGVPGLCIATSQCAGAGTSVPGYCPGTPVDIQCCI